VLKARVQAVSEPCKTLSVSVAGDRFERKADAPSRVKKQKTREAIEGLELSRELAKQVLSQLS
jgi:hypothetical protein